MEFESFDTFDEMLAAIDKARVAADSRVLPWQSEIKPGDYFVQGTPYGFLIFGQVLEADDAFYKSDEGKHYRLCQCYSVACPEGEMGDVHVSVIGMVINETVFKRFEAKGWTVEPGDSLK